MRLHVALSRRHRPFTASRLIAMIGVLLPTIWLGTWYRLIWLSRLAHQLPDRNEDMVLTEHPLR